MKKLLYILLLALPMSANAQKNLEGFWGLNFYMSPDMVKEVIKARTGKLPEEGSGPTVIGYKNCDFGGNKAYFVQLVFSDDKLYGGDIVITPAKEELLAVYTKIVSDISSKYHKPEKENCLYSHVCTNDNAEAKIFAIWNFPPGKSNPNARIIAAIENNAIKISYRDGLIFNQLITSVEKQGLSDY
jgi:hypothetical protein